METRQYLCIDLKSFYASVECVERGLDPMTTNLVVADPERSDKTICLAVTPAMKALGVHNRCRIFEIPPTVEYLVAPPRMKRYVEYAAEIYAVYLQFVSAEDIHVYSIDEAFLDVTHYMALYGMTAKELAQTIMGAVFDKMGIRATCGVGTNLYLAKIALDITAKHAEDFIGVLNEESYRKTMWDHKPLTDFWRIGKGTAKKLETYGIHTMGQIARTEEELLYRWFGIDAELLIDHAWGREPVTIADIKGYKAKSNCLTSGQVLMQDYDFDEGRLIVKEMMDLLCLDMTKNNLLTDSLTLHIGYSNQLKREPAHGSASIAVKTNAAGMLIPAVAALYDRIVDPSAPIRRVNLTCNRVEADTGFEQLSLFARPETGKREQKLQQAVLGIKERFGKNAILKGMNLEESATTRERNRQIGGHKSGE